MMEWLQVSKILWLIWECHYQYSSHPCSCSKWCKAIKSATKYIISGTFESVKSATAQFEKILGLQPGTSIIVDTTNKSKAKVSSSLPSASTSAAGNNENNNDTETEIAKKARRKQKRGGKKGGNNNEHSTPRGVKDGQPPIAVVGEDTWEGIGKGRDRLTSNETPFSIS